MRQSKYEDGMTEGEYIEAHRPERIKNKQSTILMDTIWKLVPILIMMSTSRAA